MKNLLFLLALLTTSLTLPRAVSAYGGGGGFPPGQFDNPRGNSGLVCTWEARELVNGKTIYVPRCRLVEEPVSPLTSSTEKSDINYRIQSFLGRLLTGGR